MKKMNKNNIKWFITSCISLCVLFGLYGCNEDEVFEKEQYEKVLCLLSDGDHVFTVVHSLNEDVTTGNFSVVIGGSNPIDQDVTVEFEPETELLDQYNKKMFDINTGKFARLLSPSRYTIPSMSLTIKANSVEQYGLLPVQVNTVGLSPDTTYMIPLRIKSVSNYTINRDKANVLYRIRTKNQYASTQDSLNNSLTNYGARGTVQGEYEDAPSALNTTKSFVPLTKNTVRFYPGKMVYDRNTATVAELRKNAVIIQVNANYTVDLLPYGTIDVQKIQEYGSDNTYEEILFNNKLRRSFILHYKYRTVNDDGLWSDWTEVNETLRRNE
jgi:hypothetical protein